VTIGTVVDAVSVQAGSENVGHCVAVPPVHLGLCMQ
jgi:hypothetical protein